MIATALVVNVLTTLAFVALLNVSGYAIVVRQEPSFTTPDSAWGEGRLQDTPEQWSRGEERELSEMDDDELTLKEKMLLKQKERRQQLKKEREKLTKRESYRVVLPEEGITYLPQPANADPGGVTGTQIMMNGNVYPFDDINVKDNKIVGKIPTPVPGSMFTQRCMATKGEASSPTNVLIEEAMCEYTICIKKGDRGCLFLRMGGLYEFNPFSTDPTDAPMVFAAIVGGTKGSAGFRGGARVKTLVRSNGKGDGIAVYQVDLYYQKDGMKHVPIFKPPSKS